MENQVPVLQTVQGLLITQLLAAEVYAEFLHMSSHLEAGLWEKMLADELEHVNHLKGVLGKPLPDSIPIPEVNVHRMRMICAQVLENAGQGFILRLEGALRLECAELDYGLEGLIARRLEKNEILIGYRGDISLHLEFILGESKRYSTSPNINMQMRRLNELLETSLSDTKVYE